MAGGGDCVAKLSSEEVMYVTCPRYDSVKPDYLATIDVNPKSSTYGQVIHRLHFERSHDEIHHFGWNACSSCTSVKRTHLILPCLHSSCIYVLNVVNDPLAPRLETIIEAEKLFALDVSFPHTSHCMPDGNVLISTLGDANGNPKGSFIIIDGTTFAVKGKWAKDGDLPFGYDYWYQPRQNVMLSTEWGSPNLIRSGFNPQHVVSGKYGHSLHVWRWKEREVIQTIELDEVSGSMPLEVRFLHNPDSTHAYVGCALGSSIYHVYKNDTDGCWVADKVVQIPAKKVSGWLLPDMPALITDILISKDDKYLYCSCWMHGDVRQYDISDPFHPKLTGKVFIGGSVCKGGPVTVVEDSELSHQPEPCIMGDRRVDGGPQMLQLSLDGQRLYVTTSLYSIWDSQFYPDLIKHGACMLMLDADTENGGLRLNRRFFVDFGKEPDGPVLAHEMRYPGGDCTSDICV